MDTFVPPVQPSANGTQQTVTFRDITTKFGDGYTSDVPDGLNAAPGTFNVVWNTIGASEAQAIVGFMKAHQASPFYWTPPGETAPRKWKCQSYQRSYPSPTWQALALSLEERFTV